MVVGIGIDLVEVTRIEEAIRKFGDRFVERVLHPEEIAYCRSMKSPAPSIAARFAAKEAVSKALGTGIGTGLAWHDILVVRLPSGAPLLELRGPGADLLRRRGARTAHVSLTHTRDHAAAVVVLES